MTALDLITQQMQQFNAYCYLTGRGYCSSDEGLISPRTGQVISWTAALETERYLTTLDKALEGLKTL